MFYLRGLYVLFYIVNKLNSEFFMVNGGIRLRHLHLPFCSTPTRFALAQELKKPIALSVHMAFCGREIAQDCLLKTNPQTRNILGEHKNV